MSNEQPPPSAEEAKPIYEERWNGDLTEAQLFQRRVSDPIPQYVKPLLSTAQNRGRRVDRHGRYWRLFELSHTGLTESQLPDELTSRP
jgi:hypothetical protein